MEAQMTVCVRQPDEHLCAGWQVERIAPVLEAARASYPKHPGTAIIIDRIGQELITRKRIRVVYRIDLEIAGAQ